MNIFVVGGLAGLSLLPILPDPFHNQDHVNFWEWTIRGIHGLIYGEQASLAFFYTKENYNEHWKGLNYNGKTILDIGADVGSTALYFTEMGASKIYAVEGNPYYYASLESNSSFIGDVTSINMFVDTKEKLSYLIHNYPVDVMKIDIEGGEILLADMDDSTLQLIPEYIIEVHNQEIFTILNRRFMEANYKISSFVFTNGCPILIVERKPWAG